MKNMRVRIYGDTARGVADYARRHGRKENEAANVLINKALVMLGVSSAIALPSSDPAESGTVSAYLPNNIRTAVRAFATRNRMSVSAAVKNLLIDGLRANGTPI